ncbi:FAD-binding protein [Coraliomargarita algicola]|uniref:FAD-binding protein n=1 Tax=Coraliomargarita algicola TaxID=3092156 RepID=A0ABZ0RP98_9BACT|nr:FAD-binding protein [Coraliomargarita sp. J2-16]WPJ97059.1 FAD-binding protein [Coraliomargarita sp. J2-16]
MNRRHFLGAAGGTCAVLGAAYFWGKDSAEQSPSHPPHMQTSKKPKNASEGSIRECFTEVLVVGGGMAGVFAAVKAHDHGAKVILVDKGAVGRSGQTPFARGIFRYDEQKTGLSKEAYLQKTAEAAEYINNPAYTRLMLDRGPDCIDELTTWGFFDEACYAKAMTKPLADRGIQVIQRVTLTNLLEDQGRVVGAMGMFIDNNESLVVHARSVILCTGAGGFKPAGWQISSLTHDGDAMAYRIGAEITGKEWVDGHGMRNNGLEGLSSVLSFSSISPMLGVEENIEVSKNGPMTEMRMGPPPGAKHADGAGPGGPPSGGKEGPQLAGGPNDSKGPGGGPPGGGPPGGIGGPPPGMQMCGGASAGMSQHKGEGLFPADDRCASNIPGLYAAGDSLGSMQSGGIYTQVGSSLVGSAAQGCVAGQAAAEYVKQVQDYTTPMSTLKQINTRIYAPYLRERGFSPDWVTHTLQGIMIPNFILYVKSEERLQAALTYVEYLRDHQLPLLMADDLHELRKCHETANMVLNAEMKLRTSLMRKESRGSHYREDYPERNDRDWLCWIKIRQSQDGAMELLKHPIPPIHSVKSA